MTSVGALLTADVLTSTNIMPRHLALTSQDTEQPISLLMTSLFVAKFVLHVYCSCIRDPNNSFMAFWAIMSCSLVDGSAASGPTQFYNSVNACDYTPFSFQYLVSQSVVGT
jgi:hypothetical protein